MNRAQLIDYLVEHLKLFHELKMRTGQLQATSEELGEFLVSERTRFEAMTTDKLRHIYWRNYVYEDFFDALANVPAPESCQTA